MFALIQQNSLVRTHGKSYGKKKRMCRDSRVQLDALETNIFLQEKGTETWHAVSKAYVVFFQAV